MRALEAGQYDAGTKRRPSVGQASAMVKGGLANLLRFKTKKRLAKK